MLSWLFWYFLYSIFLISFLQNGYNYNLGWSILWFFLTFFTKSGRMMHFWSSPSLSRSGSERNFLKMGTTEQRTTEWQKIGFNRKLSSSSSSMSTSEVSSLTSQNWKKNKINFLFTFGFHSKLPIIYFNYDDFCCRCLVFSLYSVCFK